MQIDLEAERKEILNRYKALIKACKHRLEKGDKEIFIERTEDALKTNAEVIATACPFCMTMLTDGLKYKNKEEEIKNYDIAELVAQALKL